MTAAKHFLTLMDLTPDDIRGLIERAVELKRQHREGHGEKTLAGKVLAMIFTKASTRTRVSFEAGIAQLGGSALFLSGQDTQLGRGEPIEDTARVISSMVDIVMIRTFAHTDVEQFAAHSQVPVINGLTDDYHPCQILADLQTYFEARGDISGKKVCWLGDGNNVCHSWMNAARQLEFEMVIACPDGYEPDSALLSPVAMWQSWNAILPSPPGTLICWSQTCGRRWVRKKSSHSGRPVWRHFNSIRRCWIWQLLMHCICIACPPIAAKKSARSSWIHPIPSSGKKRKTAFTRKKR